MELRMTFNFWSSCFCLPRAGGHCLHLSLNAYFSFDQPRASNFFFHVVWNFTDIFPFSCNTTISNYASCRNMSYVCLLDFWRLFKRQTTLLPWIFLCSFIVLVCLLVCFFNFIYEYQPSLQPWIKTLKVNGLSGCLNQFVAISGFLYFC